ncbi:MAG TPA: SDR family NAD(P)-dependent oxidoreductase [Acidimicrobiales bacterium]|nr:SDR family NAD(P)-dependent oxidoreductase [Acidimicrobiales bacterium]
MTDTGVREGTRVATAGTDAVALAPAPSPWRRALVTGASSGIGEAFADELAVRGVDLVVVGRDLRALEIVADRARMLGVHVEVIRADLSDEHGVATVVSSIRDADPMIDLLVNNAGVGRAGALADLSSVDLHETMRVNNEALVRLTHAALPRMIEADRGCLVHVSSAASRGPVAGHALYVATKAFVTNFGQSLSKELSDTNITSTTVLAGYTRTRYFERNGMSPEIAESRWATAEQVARQALDAAFERRSLVTTGPSHRWLRQLSTRFPGLASSYPGRMLKQLRVLVVSLRR